MEAIETKRIHLRFTRSLSSYDNHADAQQRISRKLASLLPHQADACYRRILEIGCGTGGFTRTLKHQCRIDEWILNDLCEDCREKINQLLPGFPHRFIAGDAEKLSFPGRFDLIASASVFQWMKEPETFLHKLSDLLMSQGVLLFSTFSPGNLYEIKKLTGKGLVYPTSDALVKWLSAADFDLLHHEEEAIAASESNRRHGNRKRPLDKRPAGIILPAICGTVHDNRRSSDTHIPPALYTGTKKIK